MRIVFMGTPDFAVPSLRALLEGPDEVVGVFCQPDRPSGRGHKLTACPVKQEAEHAGIPVFQPERIKSPEGLQMLRGLAPDLCVTAAFGQLLSQANLDVPRLGTVNVHASLLPRHRGSAPVQHAIRMGDSETGVTTMMTDIGMDTGDILLRASTRIEPTDTAGTLTRKLALLGAELLMETIEALRDGSLPRVPQDNARATTEPKITREMGQIDFAAGFRAIDCLTRAMDPWPGAYTTIAGEVMKIFRVQRLGAASAVPGTVIRAEAKGGLVVSCGDCDMQLVEIQMPGQRRMSAADYLLGHTIAAGIRLGA